MLQKRGYLVLEADDGRAAVDLYRESQSRIDLVLLDMTLPGMPGHEVLADLRRTNPRVKAVLTSAYGKEAVLRSLGAQEPCPFIRKPYSLADLIELLDKVGVRGGRIQ
jgi:CheY-like chemotaxis protein